MKKILFLILCIFSMKEVHASTLNYENLPYYVLINDEVIQIKKISDDKGNALFNVDYKNYKLSELRKNISYVFQEPVILNMSIKDNLMYGNENIQLEDVIKVCKEKSNAYICKVCETM